MQIRKLFAVSLLVLASVGTLVGLIGSRNADARPSKEVYHIYYYDAAKTQYAGEELLLSCWGATHQMLDGVRTLYYKKTSESCETGAWAATCFNCSAGTLLDYPTLPVCYQQTAVNCR